MIDGAGAQQHLQLGEQAAPGRGPAAPGQAGTKIATQASLHRKAVNSGICRQSQIPSQGIQRLKPQAILVQQHIELGCQGLRLLQAEPQVAIAEQPNGLLVGLGLDRVGAQPPSGSWLAGVVNAGERRRRRHRVRLVRDPEQGAEALLGAAARGRPALAAGDQYRQRRRPQTDRSRDDSGGRRKQRPVGQGNLQIGAGDHGVTGRPACFPLSQSPLVPVPGSGHST